MNVVLNGTPKELPPGTTVAALIESMELGTDTYAVEINARVVKKNQHPVVAIQDGDRIEVVTFVGGG